MESLIKSGDWIERHVAMNSGYCKWAKVIDVNSPSSVSVHYLDGATLIKDNMIMQNGNWVLEHTGPSGMKVRSASLAKELLDGPPFILDSKTNTGSYDKSIHNIWRLQKKSPDLR